MSLFQRRFVQPESNFTPLFRLLEDFDNYTSKNTGDGNRRHGGHFPSFQPNFDVREVTDAYELHGELPGIDKENVKIEFTDPQTLHISGHVERSYTSGSPPAELLDEAEKSGAITEAGEGEGEGGKQATAQTSEAAEDKAKYWVAERSFGKFSRVFNFPQAVQQDGVTATFKDGILTLHVPKAQKPEARRIKIQ